MMSDPRSLLERESRRFIQQDGAFERLVRRRDRKRRNQRIAAGVVGLALFVAVVLIVGTAGVSDRMQGPAGGVETGPTATGPTENESVIGDPSSVGFEGGLPPEGVPPSEPLRGELVMKEGAIQPWSHVRLYADGRLIWAVEVDPDEVEGRPDVSVWIEQRLTPEGVELLRSGAVELAWAGNPGRFLPASAWEDPELRPYVPSRYAVCAESPGSLPDPAADLLRSTERIPPAASRYIEEAECFEVTIDHARALAEILSDAGFEDPGAEDTALYSTDTNDVTVEYQLILPDGVITVPIGG